MARLQQRVLACTLFRRREGHIRHHVFGEGQYEQSEVVIQRLLTEAGNSGIPTGLASADARGAEAAADWDDLGSGENYVGYERTENFASSSGIKADKAHVYAVAGQLRRNQWALSGNWTMGREARTAQIGGMSRSQLLLAWHVSRKQQAGHGAADIPLVNLPPRNKDG